MHTKPDRPSRRKMNLIVTITVGAHNLFGTINSCIAYGMYQFCNIYKLAFLGRSCIDLGSLRESRKIHEKLMSSLHAFAYSVFKHERLNSNYSELDMKLMQCMFPNNGLNVFNPSQGYDATPTYARVSRT